jgi:hypothetical protein
MEMIKPERKVVFGSKQTIGLILCFVLAITLFPVAAYSAPVAQIDWTQVKPEEVTATLSPDISITLDGKKLDLLNEKGAEVAPLNCNGSVFVPVRAVGYAFGCMTGWLEYPDADIVVGLKDMREVKLWTEWDKSAYGEVVVPRKVSEITNKTPRNIKAVSSYSIFVTLDQTLVGLRDATGNRIAPILYDGTTYLPIRSIAQIFGCGVDWNNGTRTVMLTSEGQPLTGNNPYVPLRVPTEAENKAFLENAPDNSVRNQKLIDWLYANTDVLVSYISSHYGGENSNYTYGLNGNRNIGYFETDAVKAHFSKLAGNSDRETIINVVSDAGKMVVYGGYKSSTPAKTLSEPRPYVLDCYGSSEFVVAALKAANIPAFRVNGTHLNSNTGHAWVACYLPDENAWEFIEATAISSGYTPFYERREIDQANRPEEIALPGGVTFALDTAYPLAASYYLHYVYPNQVTQ